MFISFEFLNQVKTASVSKTGGLPKRTQHFPEIKLKFFEKFCHFFKTGFVGFIISKLNFLNWKFFRCKLKFCNLRSKLKLEVFMMCHFLDVNHYESLFNQIL